MKSYISGKKTFVLVVLLFALTGCGDENDGLPFWIKATAPTIDLQDPGSDKMSMITATIFDDKGAPMIAGKMFFTLSQNARGYFVNEEGERVSAISIDLDDGVAEASYHPTFAPETVVIRAYCPSYPGDRAVSTTVRVINSYLKADFASWADKANKLKVYFYDESGYPDETPVKDLTFSWDFGDGTISTQRDPIHIYAAAGTYNVFLTLSTGSQTDTVGYSILVKEK